MSSAASSNRPDKVVTRRLLLSRRDGLEAPHRKTASARIAEHACDLVPRGGTVALYAPKGTEVDTLVIDQHVRRTGGRVVYPRIAETTALAFHQVIPDQLVTARFGLREPPPDGDTFVPIAEIEAFVVPGIAFDRRGWRIGWGRGHYDATLAAARPTSLRIGLAFECQVVDDVPHAPHDARLHYVVTERATYEAQ